MKKVLIVRLGDDMSPNAAEDLKYAISLWRGVRGVEWQEAATDPAALAERVRVFEAALADAMACNCETESDNPEDHLRDCPYRAPSSK